MKDQIPTQPRRAVEIGQEAMKVMVKEPIKEAVKETLDEEDVIPREEARDSQSVRPERTSSETESPQSEQSQPPDSDSGLSGRKMIIPAVALVGIALALRRLSEEQLDTEQLSAVLDDDGEPSMGEEPESASSEDSHREPTDDEAAEVDF